MVDRGPTDSGPWERIGQIDAAQTGLVDRLLTPNTRYFYRVGSYNSASFATPSWSGVSYATTLGHPNVTHKLTVNSANPASGVTILTDNDNFGHGGGATPVLNQIYNSGASATLVALNPGNGNIFLKWQQDGSDYAGKGNVTTVVMDADHTITAVYGSATSTRTLMSLAITGPASIPEAASAQFSAIALYSDGSKVPVQAAWSLAGTVPATIGPTTGVVNAGSVSSNVGVTVVAAYTDGVNSVAASQSAIITNRSTVAATYALTLNYDNSAGSVSSSSVTSSIAPGTTVQLYAGARTQYHFTGWSGDATGNTNPLNVVMNSNKRITANFADGGDVLGNLIVNINPPEAATWGFNDQDIHQSGATVSTWPGSFFLTLHPGNGWLGPDQILATVTKESTTTVSASFTRDLTPGVLSVTISPPEAAAAGAKWHVNGGTYDSGASVSMPPGKGYAVTFDAIAGWTPPAAQSIDVLRGQTAVSNGAYTPPQGSPAIASVSPSIGPLKGGTAITIRGSNFDSGSTVSIGGAAVGHLSVADASEITCTSPASVTYGTVDVTVQTAKGTVTATAGFSYGVPRGTGIQLVGSIGGYIDAVAVSGSYCFVGEGSTFLVLDASSPAAPFSVARIPLPGQVIDIALLAADGKQYAVVADLDSGLQVVDITDPTHPLLRGYYQLAEQALGVAIQGTNAYVANGNAGLTVLSLADPTRPTLVSTLALGYCDRLYFAPGGNASLAYASLGGALGVLDVTLPSAPVLLGKSGSVTDPFLSHSIAVAGTRGYLTVPTVQWLSSMSQIRAVSLR